MGTLRSILLLTNHNFPVLGSVGDLIGRPHLGVGNATDNKDDQPRADLVTLLSAIFMPLTVAGAKRRQIKMKEEVIRH